MYLRVEEGYLHLNQQYFSHLGAAETICEYNSDMALIHYCVLLANRYLFTHSEDAEIFLHLDLCF